MLLWRGKLFPDCSRSLFTHSCFSDCWFLLWVEDQIHPSLFSRWKMQTRYLEIISMGFLGQWQYWQIFSVVLVADAALTQFNCQQRYSTYRWKGIIYKSFRTPFFGVLISSETQGSGSLWFFSFHFCSDRHVLDTGKCLILSWGAATAVGTGISAQPKVVRGWQNCILILLQGCSCGETCMCR